MACRIQRFVTSKIPGTAVRLARCKLVEHSVQKFVTLATIYHRNHNRESLVTVLRGPR